MELRVAPRPPHSKHNEIGHCIENPEQPSEARQPKATKGLAHTDFINNWDLVDLSCYELLGNWLLDKDRMRLYRLAEPRRTLWENRIAIVTTTQFIRNGEFNDTLAIADKLMAHPHDLIHKAVGWLLREVGKRDRKLLESYQKPRYKTMPRTMLRYAIERFPGPPSQALHGGQDPVAAYTLNVHFRGKEEKI